MREKKTRGGERRSNAIGNREVERRRKEDRDKESSGIQEGIGVKEEKTGLTDLLIEEAKGQSRRAAIRKTAGQK